MSDDQLVWAFLIVVPSGIAFFLFLYWKDHK